MKTAEEIFEKRFEKFRIGIFRLSLDHFLETGKLSGSALLEVREAMEEYASEAIREKDNQLAAKDKEIEQLREALATVTKEQLQATVKAQLFGNTEQLKEKNQQL